MLRPGQIGCLLRGTYGNLHSWQLLSKNGRRGRPISIKAYPGQHARVRGWIDITGSHTTISGLDIDGSNTLNTNGRCRGTVSDALAIEGVGDIVERSNIYQSVRSLRSSGISVGFSGNGSWAVIRWNKIHDVGQCYALDHLIYLARGNHVRIYRNWMWNDSHGWGVQIYPSVSRAAVFSNVIDHAGSGITVGGSSVTSHNWIANNVITNSTGLRNAGLQRGVAISDYWVAAAGVGNIFVHNDSYDNPGGLARVSHAIRLFQNVKRVPLFVDAPHHNYRLRRGSPLAKWGLWGG